MDAETRDKIHKVELHQKDQDARMDGFERLLQQQSQAFKDFKDMVNGWAKKFAYLAIAAIALGLSDESGGSKIISIINKLF